MVTTNHWLIEIGCLFSGLCTLVWPHMHISINPELQTSFNLTFAHTFTPMTFCIFSHLRTRTVHIQGTWYAQGWFIPPTDPPYSKSKHIYIQGQFPPPSTQSVLLTPLTRDPPINPNRINRTSYIVNIKSQYKIVDKVPPTPQWVLSIYTIPISTWECC